MNWWILLVAEIVAGVCLVIYLIVSHKRRHAVAAVDIDTNMPSSAEEVEDRVDDKPPPPPLEAFQLIDEHEILPDQRKLISEQLKRIVTPPRGIQCLMSADVLAGDATRELAALVMSEPRLSEKVLERANSPFFELQKPIDTVPGAITYLGMNTVRNMTLSFQLEEAFASVDPELQLYYDNIRASGLLASELCSLFARKLGLPDSGALCTQTVLSFLGELAAPALLGHRILQAYDLSLLERLRFEQETIGVSSALLATSVMREWGIPASIIEAVSATNRVIVTPATQLPAELAIGAGLAYICARFGEAITRRQIKYIGRLNLLNDEVAELFHLQSYLRLQPLTQIPGLLKTPDIRLSLIRIIAAARNEAEGKTA